MIVRAHKLTMGSEHEPTIKSIADHVGPGLRFAIKLDDCEPLTIQIGKKVTVKAWLMPEAIVIRNNEYNWLYASRSSGHNILVRNVDELMHLMRERIPYC